VNKAAKKAAGKAVNQAAGKAVKKAAGKAVKKAAGKAANQAAPTRRARRPAVAVPGATGAAGRIDEMIGRLGDWRGERLAEFRALVHRVDPEVIEEWKWMGTPVWSHDGMYVLANAHKDKVKLTFFHGAQLPDPDRLFNAGLDGNKWRAIDLRAGDRIDRTALAALLRSAVAYNATHAVPRSKGSRAALLARR